MPTRPGRVCLDCSKIVTGGKSRCPEHQAVRDQAKAAYQRSYAAKREQERPSASVRGYGWNWRRLRAQVLADEPYCEECARPATEVDHRLAKGLGGTDARSNLRALCHACHLVKTMRDKRLIAEANRR